MTSLEPAEHDIEEEEKPLPAIFEHACTVYKLMEDEAVLEEGVLIWEGHLTKLFQRLRMSVPYYTSVMRELRRMGCVAQKRRGGGNASSQWFIRYAPTEELFRTDMNRTGNVSAARRTRIGMLEQQVKDLARGYTKIQEDYDTIIQILQERESTHV